MASTIAKAIYPAPRVLSLTFNPHLRMTARTIADIWRTV